MPDGDRLCYTAEHSYPIDPNIPSNITWYTKLPPGKYTCQRGEHRLAYMPPGTPFDTFEVLAVPGHTGILCCHVGNKPQKDSDGCILAGMEMGVNFLLKSKLAFVKFMSFQTGINQFRLVVENVFQNPSI
jgi:hypothetical protein